MDDRISMERKTQVEMEVYMGRSILMSLVLVQLFGLGVLAWAGSERGGGAGRADGREPASIMRSDSRRDLLGTFKGILSCEMPEENTGEACILKLTAENGEILTIPASNHAMRLFQSGRTNVLIQGEKLGSVIKIRTIKAL